MTYVGTRGIGYPESGFFGFYLQRERLQHTMQQGLGAWLHERLHANNHTTGNEWLQPYNRVML